MGFELDIASVNLATAAVSLSLALAMVVVNFSRQTYPGFFWWVAGACAASAAFGLMALHGVLPPTISVVLANALHGAYASFTAAGLQLFFRGRPRWLGYAAVVAVDLAVSLFFTFVVPSMPIRAGLVVVLLCSMWTWCAWLVAREAPRQLGASNPLAFWAFATMAGWSLCRVVFVATLGAELQGSAEGASVTALFFLVMTALLVLVSLGLTALDRQRMECDLKAAADELTHLRGIVPICAGCKCVREGEKWTPVEVWVGAHSEAEFSHGLCPACVERLYPELK